MRLTQLIGAGCKCRAAFHLLMLSPTCLVFISYLASTSAFSFSALTISRVLEMSEDSPHLRAQQLAYRVWKLPHFRLSVFEQLVALRETKSNTKEVHKYLMGLLTLDMESFREAAMLLYRFIRLDDFPWACPSEVCGWKQMDNSSDVQDRIQLYAASVRCLYATGCLPLCKDWSFTDMLQFFPNVQSISFTFPFHSGVKWSRKASTVPGTRGQIDHFTVHQQVRIQDGVLAPVHSFHPPSDTVYEVSYKMKSSYEPIAWEGPPFALDGDGEVVLPEVLKLPYEELATEGTHPSPVDWLMILEHRKKLGIPTRNLEWEVWEGEDPLLMTRVAGPDVTTLSLKLFPVMKNLTTNLNTVMNSIRDDLLPGLDSLHLCIRFSHMVAAEKRELGETAFPDWFSNDMPSKLRFVTLDFDVEGYDICEGDWSDYESATASEAEKYVRDALPLSWIRNMRLKFGPGLCLRVAVSRDEGERIKDWDEPFEDTLDQALYAPITLDKSAQTAGHCTCSCEF